VPVFLSTSREPGLQPRHKTSRTKAASAAEESRSLRTPVSFAANANDKDRSYHAHFAKMITGAFLPVHRTLLLCAIVSASLCACLSSSDTSAPPPPAKDSVQITKLPPAYASHKFDPSAPPPNMPPLHPGEAAVCDADFIARSAVRGQPRRSDKTHAMLTITQVIMTLQL